MYTRPAVSIALIIETSEKTHRCTRMLASGSGTDRGRMAHVPHQTLSLDSALGRCPDAEFVAVGVGELGPFAPGFRAQLFGQSDPTGRERFAGCVNVVSVQDIAGPAGFVATHLAAQAEHDVGLCSRRSHFEPALRCAHGLIGDLLKTQRVDIKVEGPVLVAHANADGTDFCEHVYLLPAQSACTLER